VSIVDVADLAYALPGGWTLFEGVSFRVPEGNRAALIGANGIGKSTLLRIVAGLEEPARGTLNVPDRIGLMRQMIGSDSGPRTVREFLLAYAERPVADAGRRLLGAEAALQGEPTEKVQLAYANALAAWEEAGGYRAEVVWDACTSAAFGQGYPVCADRSIDTLSGGERKRLALEALFRSDFDVLLLDEPDNFLDIEGKHWLEDQMVASPKTILFVSHDRAVLAKTATRVLTLEAKGVWTHPEGYATYGAAREARLEQLEEEHRRYAEQHQHLVDAVRRLKQWGIQNDKLAARARAVQRRLDRFEEQNAPREKPQTQHVRIGIEGGRTGKMALRVSGLSIPGIIDAFDAELSYGERIGIIGPNGSGKSHFLRLLGGEEVAHEGEFMLGARVQPALFRQLHDRPDLVGVTLVEVLQKRGMSMNEAMSILKRYELAHVGRSTFELLSGGQQARLQLLLMEIESPTMLLLDEPTDNLDVAAADALEDAILRYRGTVVAVTHDRWFMRLMDRFLFFEAEGPVVELLESPWAEELVGV
jgi:ATPase subunit of ABC transporter with duplicated ATPase domains